MRAGWNGKFLSHLSGDEVWLTSHVKKTHFLSHLSGDEESLTAPVSALSFLSHLSVMKLSAELVAASDNF